jgi:hypothetical protein
MHDKILELNTEFSKILDTIMIDFLEKHKTVDENDCLAIIQGGLAHKINLISFTNNETYDEALHKLSLSLKVSYLYFETLKKL